MCFFKILSKIRLSIWWHERRIGRDKMPHRVAPSLKMFFQNCAHRDSGRKHTATQPARIFEDANFVPNVGFQKMVQHQSTAFHEENGAIGFGEFIQ